MKHIPPAFHAATHHYVYSSSKTSDIEMGTWCRGSAGISKVVRPLEIKDHLCTCMGGVSTTMCNHVQEANQLRWEDCTQCSCFQKVVSETGKTGAGGESCNSPMRRARLRSRTTASSRMRHIASSYMSYTLVYLATCGCRCSLGTRPTTRWKVVQPRLDQPDQRHRLCGEVHIISTLAL